MSWDLKLAGFTIAALTFTAASEGSSRADTAAEHPIVIIITGEEGLALLREIESIHAASLRRSTFGSADIAKAGIKQ